MCLVFPVIVDKLMHEKLFKGLSEGNMLKTVYFIDIDFITFSKENKKFCKKVFLVTDLNICTLPKAIKAK